jgi:probable phosphoglycerate mutase
LRHGQTEWNAAERLQGRIDSPLTATGLQQATRQRQMLERCDLGGFEAYSSPQGRAFHTAALVLVGLMPRIQTDSRLAEIGIGDWEGKRRSEIVIDSMLETGPERALELYQRAPGGEGFHALHNRCRDFLGALRGPAVLVTHGITSRMLRLIALDMDISEIGDLPGGQGVVFQVQDGVQKQLSFGA